MKKLAILFPGRNYSCDRPLLYYAGKIFEKRGYEIIRLDYNYYLKNDKSDMDNISVLIEEAKHFIQVAMTEIDYSQYDDIVFVSKSMGATLAGYFDQKLKIRARHIVLTPTVEALPYLKTGHCLVVAGKEDRYLDSHKLKIFCVEQNIALKQFDDVGHSLEYPDDIAKSFAILMVLVRMFKEF